MKERGGRANGREGGGRGKERDNVALLKRSGNAPFVSARN